MHGMFSIGMTSVWHKFAAMAQAAWMRPGPSYGR